ncbi:hypothetical protein MVEG_07620 [Podila verticillata NRRL 6337]|nr:hypothetical protein MVEG_07620 [Podila verticillata NRRL 6337]
MLLIRLAHPTQPASSADQASAEKLYAEQYQQYAQQYQAWAAANPGYQQTPEGAAPEYAAYYQQYQQPPAPGTQTTQTPDEQYAQQYAAYYAQYGYPASSAPAPTAYPGYYPSGATSAPAPTAYPYPGYPTSSAPAQPSGAASLTHYPSYSYPPSQPHPSNSYSTPPSTGYQGEKAPYNKPYAPPSSSNGYYNNHKQAPTNGAPRKPAFDYQAFQRQKQLEAEQKNRQVEESRYTIQSQLQEISLDEKDMKTKTAKPLYHSVKSKNSTPSQSNVFEPKADTAQGNGWPQSLKDYVQRVFETIADSDRDLAQSELKTMVSQKHIEGKLWNTDWDLMAVPAKYKRKSKRLRQSTSPEPVHIPDSERQRREKRMRRFEDSNKPAVTAPVVKQEPPVYNADVIDWDAHTIVGTSTKLEKPYLRLTSAPDPSTVRPPHILEKTLQLLKSKWREDPNYTYICDQFKSVRQDLTVQRIKNELTVSVYEIHARIALEKGDLGEYNQCQTQLKQLYEYNIPGNVMEFTAYRILYLLHTRNPSDIISMLASLTQQQKEDLAVKHALQVRTAMASSNYYKLFRLYATAPNMGGYLMDQFVDRERVEALKSICKAYRPNIEFRFLVTTLGFVSSEECIKFLKDINVTSDSKALNLTTGILDTKIAFPIVTLAGQKYLKVDIKGQL